MNLNCCSVYIIFKRANIKVGSVVYITSYVIIVMVSQDMSKELEFLMIFITALFVIWFDLGLKTGY